MAEEEEASKKDMTNPKPQKSRVRNPASKQRKISTLIPRNIWSPNAPSEIFKFTSRSLIT